ncbi:uncharacterized protein K489DRAFT_376110 [Dissoconium aciculare CBS 342.82]|uniref:Uncharacterized protein n=1 Tax=Dissoconium aciculare CBS 342.82 TaxID=1314786 RepID=A0A6J3MJ61_9PEZI|nr:uncharacterized protein K489DRAFT_376110 [Dissoconium aciculare CBS 342.82]KAF1827951.1 hypothetical protein K489DRAFT_376110 [Dissoconium aciculare CBS 342.82]
MRYGSQTYFNDETFFFFVLFLIELIAISLAYILSLSLITFLSYPFPSHVIETLIYETVSAPILN